MINNLIKETMPDIKAFVITNDYENEAVVLFNKHRASAQSDGANELNVEFEEVSCRRKKEYDKFYPKVPISQLIKDGWWYECSCGTPLYEDEVTKIDDKENTVYCKKCEVGK